MRTLVSLHMAATGLLPNAKGEGVGDGAKAVMHDKLRFATETEIKSLLRTLVESRPELAAEVLSRFQVRIHLPCHAPAHASSSEFRDVHAAQEDASFARGKDCLREMRQPRHVPEPQERGHGLRQVP